MRAVELHGIEADTLRVGRGARKRGDGVRHVLVRHGFHRVIARALHL